MRKLVESFAIATILIAAVVPSTAFAGSFVGTRVTAISVTGTQFAVIEFATVANRPSCSGTNTMVVDLLTNKGRAALSLAQTALLADLFVTGSGTNTCTNTGSGTFENLSTLAMRR